MEVAVKVRLMLSASAVTHGTRQTYVNIYTRLHMNICASKKYMHVLYILKKKRLLAPPRCELLSSVILDLESQRLVSKTHSGKAP